MNAVILQFISLLDTDECSVNNGGCSQICNNIIGGFSCECYTGYQQNQLDTSSCFVPGKSTGLCNDGLIYDNGLQEHVLVLDVIILVYWTLVMFPHVSVILATSCLMMEQHA